MPSALIVDDSKTARVVLSRLLEKHRYQVHAVESAEEALIYLENHSPDLIFMDHMMPGMDGFQAVKAIKADPTSAQIPVVMYTSKEGEVYVGQAHALGAADILTKPVTTDDLAAVLARLEPAAEPVRVAAAEPGAEESAPIAAAALDYPDAPPATESPPADTTPPPAAGLTLRPWLLGLAAVVLVWLLVLYWQASQTRAALEQREQQLFRSLEWALNQAGYYPYGEVPFGGRRLTLLEGLVSQLAAMNFSGTVRLESHVGEFCLLQLDEGALEGGWVVAPPDLPIVECDALGQPPAESHRLSARQSADFREFLTSSPVLATSDIEVELLPLGGSRPIFDYPAEAEVETAGDWNRAAQRNNRVRFLLLERRDGSL